MDKLIIGCGYLGRRVAKRWLADGNRVFALTRSTENAELLRTLGVEPILGDVLDTQTLHSLPAVETMLYAVGFDRQAAASKRDVYVSGLRNVLEVVASRVNKIIYVSSTSVYGQSNGESVSETSPTEPTTEGGCICRDAENILNELAGDSAMCLRLAGIYGPQRLLARLDSIRSGQPFRGCGDAWLNLIHVDDAVKTVEQCRENWQPGETVNVGDDRPITRSEFYTTLAALVNAPKPKFEGGDGLNKRIDNSKLHTLGVTLDFPSIDEGLPNSLEGIDTA